MGVGHGALELMAWKANIMSIVSRLNDRSVRQLGLTLRWPSSCQPRPGFPALLTLSLVTVALAPPCKPPQGHVSSAGWWGFTAAQPRQGSLYGWGQAQIGLQPSGHGGGGRRYHWGGRGEGRGTVGGGWEELWL